MGKETTKMATKIEIGSIHSFDVRDQRANATVLAVYAELDEVTDTWQTFVEFEYTVGDREGTTIQPLEQFTKMVLNQEPSTPALHREGSRQMMHYVDIEHPWKSGRTVRWACNASFEGVFRWIDSQANYAQQRGTCQTPKFRDMRHFRAYLRRHYDVKGRTVGYNF